MQAWDHVAFLLMFWLAYKVFVFLMESSALDTSSYCILWLFAYIIKLPWDICFVNFLIMGNVFFHNFPLSFFLCPHRCCSLPPFAPGKYKKTLSTFKHVVKGSLLHTDWHYAHWMAQDIKHIRLCAQIGVNIKDSSRELGLSQSHCTELVFFCTWADRQVI